MTDMKVGGALEAPPPLEVYYMKLNQDQADARLGKMHAGQIVALDKAKASRYLAAGIAEQVDSGEWEEQQERRQQKMTKRQAAFQRINDGHAMWDVSTYRDVLTAPESGLRIAAERGIPLVNVHMLRDADGDVLPPDADIEEIIEARQYLHPDLVSPLTAHDRSSVMGGGSPYTQNVQGGPMPLNPLHRAMAERVAANDQFAKVPQSLQLSRDDGEPPPPSGRAGRAAQRSRTMHARTVQGEQSSGAGQVGAPGEAPPAPPTAPTAPPPAPPMAPTANDAT